MRLSTRKTWRDSALLLKEFANNSQFIAITDNKRTVAGADVLYGVTMEESGVSKLVAVLWKTRSEVKLSLRLPRSREDQGGPALPRKRRGSARGAAPRCLHCGRGRGLSRHHADRSDGFIQRSGASGSGVTKAAPVGARVSFPRQSEPSIDDLSFPRCPPPTARPRPLILFGRVFIDGAGRTWRGSGFRPGR